MKKTAILFMILCLWTFCARAEEPSIGEQAGKAARHMQDSAEETYRTAEAKTVETSKKIEASTREAVKSMDENLRKAWQDFQAQMGPVIDNLQKEWQKFVTAYQQKT